MSSGYKYSTPNILTVKAEQRAETMKTSMCLLPGVLRLLRCMSTFIPQHPHTCLAAIAFHPFIEAGKHMPSSYSFPGRTQKIMHVGVKNGTSTGQLICAIYVSTFACLYATEATDLRSKQLFASLELRHVHMPVGGRTTALIMGNYVPGSRRELTISWVVCLATALQLPVCLHTQNTQDK
eukprot:scaffold175718_cov18-Tisochrysis_lutea.AAC.1